MLELKLFTAMLSLSFFLEAIPAELDGDGSKEVVTNSPTNVFICPRKWTVCGRAAAMDADDHGPDLCDGAWLRSRDQR